MKKILPLITVLILFKSHMYAQNATITYAGSGLCNVSSCCNVFNQSGNNPTVGGYAHWPVSGGATFDGTSIKMKTQYDQFVNPSVNTGTAYAIAYNFKLGYTYTLSIDIGVDKNLVNPSVFPRINVSSLVSLPSISASQPTACGPVGESAYQSSFGNLIGFVIPTQILSKTYTISTGFSFTSTPAKYLVITAYFGASNSSTVNINKIKLTENPSVSFSLTPSTLSIPAGTTINQTFTVNNVTNTPGVTGYIWNLGAVPNGWLYNGAAAPASISTTTNTLTLESDKCASNISNISAAATIGSANYTTNQCIVTVTGSLPSYTIAGPTLICNTSDYSIPNLPPGISVAWSIPSNAGPVLQLSQNTPSTNQLRITNQHWYGVTTDLTATATGGACPLNIPSKIIKNDENHSWNYYQGACNGAPAVSGTYTLGTSVQQGCDMWVGLGDMTGKTVTYNTNYPITWGVGSTYMFGNNTLIFNLPYGSGSIPFQFTISGDGACTGQQMLFFSTNGYGQPFTIASNPVKSTLVINKATNNSNEELNAGTQPDNVPIAMEIYSANSNSLQLTQKSIIVNSKCQVNVAKLKTGYYILKITNLKTGSLIQSIKFLKE